NPGLEQAFWDGYGEHPGPALRARIEWFVVYFALATLAWTVAGREPARTAQARVLLASRGLLPSA
ncbi:MAG: hypothetical protein ACPG4T_16450, partial [Nannocystaceae bacterium]